MLHLGIAKARRSYTHSKHASYIAYNVVFQINELLSNYNKNYENIHQAEIYLDYNKRCFIYYKR